MGVRSKRAVAARGLAFHPLFGTGSRVQRRLSALYELRLHKYRLPPDVIDMLMAAGAEIGS